MKRVIFPPRPLYSLDEADVRHDGDDAVEGELADVELLSGQRPERLRVADDVLAADERGQACRHPRSAGYPRAT